MYYNITRYIREQINSYYSNTHGFENFLLIKSLFIKQINKNQIIT